MNNLNDNLDSLVKLKENAIAAEERRKRNAQNYDYDDNRCTRGGPSDPNEKYKKIMSKCRDELL